MRPVMAGPDSTTMKYTPTFDKGKNVAHQTQSDGFRPVSGPAGQPHHSGSTSPRNASKGTGGSVSVGGKKICEHCSKTVYFAEEQLYDGKIFHISCFPIWSKKMEQKELAPRNASYDRPADVQPSYYRANNDGTGARMESGVEYKEGASTAQAGAGPKFCSGCGVQRGDMNAKFCGECGKKF